MSNMYLFKMREIKMYVKLETYLMLWDPCNITKQNNTMVKKYLHVDLLHLKQYS